MTSNQIERNQDYREFHRRKHKMLGAYLVFRTWMDEADCVVLRQNELLRYLELKELKEKRIEWLREDLSKIFPYFKIWGPKVILSRLRIPDEVLGGLNFDYLEKPTSKGGLKAREIYFGLPDEAMVKGMLDELSHGTWDFEI